MPFWRSYGHLVWATKKRNPFINDVFATRLYGQLVAKAAGIGCYVYAINGMPDHIHLVLTLPPSHSVADIVKLLKGSSAHFVNHVVRPSEYHFAWQRGYGYFTLGETQLDRAIAYVECQQRHHTANTINRWLERYTEQDEGPNPGKPLVGPAETIREHRLSLSRPNFQYFTIWGKTRFFAGISPE